MNAKIIGYLQRWLAQICVEHSIPASAWILWIEHAPNGVRVELRAHVGTALVAFTVRDLERIHKAKAIEIVLHTISEHCGQEEKKRLTIRRPVDAAVA